jgi:hypothetical protein
MNRQLALSYAVTSVATAIAAIAVVGSALGFDIGGSEDTPPGTEQSAAQDVGAFRESLLEQAVAEVEAQRAEAQASARAEVESWRANAIREIERQLAGQYSEAAGTTSSVPIAADGSLYVYAHDDDEHEKHDEHESDEHESDEHEHDEHEHEEHERDD